MLRTTSMGIIRITGSKLRKCYDEHNSCYALGSACHVLADPGRWPAKSSLSNAYMQSMIALKPTSPAPTQASPSSAHTFSCKRDCAQSIPLSMGVRSLWQQPRPWRGGGHDLGHERQTCVRHSFQSADLSRASGVLEYGFLSNIFYQLSLSQAFTFPTNQSTNQPSPPNRPSITESIRPSKHQCIDLSISFGQAHRCLVVTA